jgi:dolichol-phosphate mannosyltransferase
MQVSVILPTYCEANNIGRLIREISEILDSGGWQAEIIVVDDNSPDGTADEARACSNTPQVSIRCLIRTQERGLATAIKYGISQAQGEGIVVMDTDFNHSPRTIPQMVRLLEYYDIVIGSRFVCGGGMEDHARYRNSLLYNRLVVQPILGTPINDNISGFFAMRRDKLADLDLDFIFQGYGEYFIRLLYLARLNGYRMLEVPVFYTLRSHGESKSNFISMIRDYTRTVLSLRFQGQKLLSERRKPWKSE